MATSTLLLRSARSALRFSDLSASRCLLPATGRRASQRSSGRLFSSSKPPLGDDLDPGTTNSSCVEGGKTDKVIENSQGQRTLLGGLLFDGPPGKRRHPVTNPNNIIRGKPLSRRDDGQLGPYKIVKGPNGDDVLVEAPLRMAPYKIVKAPNGDDVQIIKVM